MDSFIQPHIDQRNVDYEFFKAQKRLGAYSSTIDAVIYEFARDAFNTAWTRGIKQAWRDEHIKLNARANERMRVAFHSIGHTQGNSTPAAPIETQNQASTMDASWFSAIVGDLRNAHIRVFYNAHVVHGPDGPTIPDIDIFHERFTRFYSVMMSVAWSAGWRAGERAAKNHLQYRNDQGIGVGTQIEQAAIELEQEGMQQAMRSLFQIYDIEDAKSASKEKMRA